MRRLLQSRYLRNFSSIFLGAIFFTAGMSKLYFEHKFPGIIGPVWLEDELAKYDLGMYARFIAYSQVIIGYLLLTLRYSLVGAIMMIPLVSNILMVTISMNWRGTPFVLAFLLAVNIYLLVFDYRNYLSLLGINSDKIKTVSQKGLSGWLIGFILVLGSIHISFYQLYVAWFVAATGLFFSFRSYLQSIITNNNGQGSKTRMVKT